MKLVRCEWAPSLVVEWLCGELEDRGIPGPTYAHTLLSLLHHHYCPHPPPIRPTPAAPALAVAAPGRRYHHPLSRRHLDDFDLRDLNLDDLLGYTAHPDADLPDLASFTPQQRGGSRRARKRHKVRQKHRILTSEQLQKVAALQCLMSASDERYDLESLVEELCLRLKTAAENEHLNASNSVQSCITKKSVALKAVVRESCNETDDYASSSTPEEQAEKYYAAFPPLSGSSKGKCGHEEPWKSGDALCSCVLEGQKSSRVGQSETIQTTKMPRNHRKKIRDKGKKEAEGLAVPGQDEAPRHHISFTWNNPGKHKEIQHSENYDTDSASEPERNIERRRKKFIGPLLDEDIGEGYIGDASSRESSEDRDKGDQDATEKPREEKCEKGSSHSDNKGRVCQEEWECMGYLLLGASDNEGKNKTVGGGNRLFERGSTSDGTSGSSSDVETQEDDSVRQLERKISNTAPQVWGQAGEFLGHGRGEHVWDPPAVQEMALYTTIWGFNFPKHQSTLESAVFDQNNSNTFLQEPSTPIHDGWQQSSWHTVNCGTEEEPHLNISVTSQSPLANLKENPFRVPENHSHMHSLEKSIWSDCNANDISGNDGTLSVCLEDAEKHYAEDEEQTHATEDLEKKLLESFMQLSLENLWDCSIDPESVCTEYPVSNSNLEVISETESFDEGAQDTHTDSDHEKMRALVEDVCKSYESHEESSLSSSMSKPVPSGPAGPHANLHHTEHSGFSMVVPRGKSTESNSSLEQRPESLVTEVEGSGMGPDTVDQSSTSQSGDTVPTTQEEENLLTSPRTHFRPIRQDSSGSTADDHYEDGTMFLVNSERPDLPFQRTGSGALFLESDLLEGSPKKYMVYKEPVPKIIHPDDQQEQKNTAIKTYPAIALVPKFKVINNEKFCQTEEEGLPGGGLFFSKHRERAKLYDKIRYTECYSRKSEEKELDVFEFQQQDFPDSNNLANIWKSGLECSDVRGLQNIWKVQRMQGGEDVWPGLRNIHKGKGIPGNVWLEKEEDGATGWSSEGHFEPPSDSGHGRKSGAVIIPSSLASLWQHGSPSDSPVIASSLHSLHDLWASFASLDDAKPGKTRRYVITNPTTHIPGKRPDNCHTLSSLIETGPWKPRDGEDNEKSTRKDQIWYESTLSTSQNHQPIGDQNRPLTLSIPAGAPVACTRLRLEVDEEADELLGAVHAQTSSSQGQLSGRHPSSPRPLHERLKKHSSGKPTAQHFRYPLQTGALASRLEGKPGSPGCIEREDLDDLAPDWELNDGFEWGPQASGSQQVEDYQEGMCGDDGGGSGEVLVWESEGTTYTLPVEYLEDSLYDQIFGASEPGSRRLGGSLPDLPSGHPSSSAVYLSSDLEDQWKKSGIPYKVQFPRKPRAGRWVPPSRRPCTFFMEGSCRRTDCRFSHDLASITCRFWEEGSCLKGITCPFLHGYPLRRRRNKSEGAAHSEGEKIGRHSSPFEIDSEMDFPALGSSCDSKSGSVDDRSGMNIGSGNCHPKVARKKKRKFITITKNVLGEVKRGDAERALRRITRRERRRRHTETAAAATIIADPPPQAKRPLRKAKRHRALASGHDDGTVSDY